jgi:phospholipase/lecithinase/hemolysin
MKFSRVFASCLFVVCALAAPLRAGEFTEIVAFGDSLTDTGNLYAATHDAFPPASDGYYQGRFSNGPVWVEWLALQLEVPAPAPFLTGGTNYAFGGAETDLKNALSTQKTPNLGTQLTFYLYPSPGATRTFRPDQLVVLWAGANDFLNAHQMDPSKPVANLSAAIEILANAGAKTIVVPNLPPLGKTPVLVGTANELVFDDLTTQFNDLLEAALDDLEENLEIRIIRLNVFHLLQRVLKKPGAFGFTNVTAPALITVNGQIGGTFVSVSPDPDDYLFWDIVHPTRVAHRDIGDLRNYFRHGKIPGVHLEFTPLPPAPADADDDD